MLAADRHSVATYFITPFWLEVIVITFGMLDQPIKQRVDRILANFPSARRKSSTLRPALE
jgi:hypothetical protein